MKCPKCGKEFPRLLALSRADHKTNICDTCGSLEAIDALEKHVGVTPETEDLRKFIIGGKSNADKH